MDIHNSIIRKKYICSVGFLQKYIENHFMLLHNPLLKAFLKEATNMKLLTMAISFPTTKNKAKLDNAFKMFFLEIRFIKYISKIIYYCSIDFDQKRRKYEGNYPLILDNPLEQNDNKALLIDLICVENNNEIEYLTNKSHNLVDHIENDLLCKIIITLTQRQQQILQLAYIKGKTDTEIAKLLNISQQSVSKTHKVALKKLVQLLNQG